MNVYRRLGDQVGTTEARELAAQLVVWHDAMVKHLRLLELRGRTCDDGCPHEEAVSLWMAAQEAFGEQAADLTFLRTHGEAAPAVASRGSQQPPMRARLHA